MGLKFCQVVPVHHSIFLNSLKDYYSSPAIPDREKLSLFVEGNGRQDVLLGDVGRVRFSQGVQWLQIERLHFVRWEHFRVHRARY